jgi:hypothetical protein
VGTPGLTTDLTAEGALLLDWTADWQFLSPWDWMPKHVSNLKSLICSRLLLEWYLRDRLLQMPGVNVQEATTVNGLTVSSDVTRITALLIQGMKRRLKALKTHSGFRKFILPFSNAA